MIDIFKNIINEFNNANAIIKGCIYMSLFFLFIIVSLILYLKNIRHRLRVKGRIVATYHKKYESDLIEYLYAGEGENISLQQQQIVDYLKKSAKNRLKRKLIIDTFLKLKNEISGETAEAIQNLYYQTGLFNSAKSELKSKKWDSIARAIRELSQFEIREAHDEIIVLVNHPKKEVRNEIQKYLVKLFGFQGLEFLDLLKNQLSEWDQIQLLEILNKFDNPDIPDMTNWLGSTNDSVVSFAIKIVKLYNQFDAKVDIIRLFNHPNPEIRIQVIEVIDRLGIYEAVAILKQDLNSRSIEEQIAFFKMMEDLFTSDDLSFVKAYVNHENFYIRVSAMKILNLIVVETDNTFKIINSDFKLDKDLTIAS